ncbi:hypothetical protein FGO68_gene7301 [Halteria grandinella]|uniref:Uncharacterized protein n=1 Tax=Halteria grandinella TaxID=5974 RepID=A0A8J8NZ80_HALGN|nr:hypothetical protein FGO68_gene7301 [Halteria grandinella]
MLPCVIHEQQVSEEFEDIRGSLSKSKLRNNIQRGQDFYSPSMQVASIGMIGGGALLPQQIYPGGVSPSRLNPQQRAALYHQQQQLMQYRQREKDYALIMTQSLQKDAGLFPQLNSKLNNFQYQSENGSSVNVDQMLGQTHNYLYLNEEGRAPDNMGKISPEQARQLQTLSDAAAGQDSQGDLINSPPAQTPLNAIFPNEQDRQVLYNQLDASMNADQGTSPRGRIQLLMQRQQLSLSQEASIENSPGRKAQKLLPKKYYQGMRMVQPKMGKAALNQKLTPQKKRFPPTDPSNVDALNPQTPGGDSVHRGKNDSLLASINPEINVIQQIYKVILNRHEILQTQRQPYIKFKFHTQGEREFQSDTMTNFNLQDSTDQSFVSPKGLNDDTGKRYVQYLKSKIQGQPPPLIEYQGNQKQALRGLLLTTKAPVGNSRSKSTVKSLPQQVHHARQFQGNNSVSMQTSLMNFNQDPARFQLNDPSTMNLQHPMMSGRSFEMTTQYLMEGSQTGFNKQQGQNVKEINEIDEADDQPHANPKWHAGVFKNPIRHDIIAFRTPGRIRKADLEKDITERRLKFREVIATNTNASTQRNIKNGSTLDIQQQPTQFPKLSRPSLANEPTLLPNISQDHRGSNAAVSIGAPSPFSNQRIKDYDGVPLKDKRSLHNKSSTTNNNALYRKNSNTDLDSVMNQQQLQSNPHSLIQQKSSQITLIPGSNHGMLHHGSSGEMHANTQSLKHIKEQHRILKKESVLEQQRQESIIQSKLGLVATQLSREGERKNSGYLVDDQ